MRGTNHVTAPATARAVLAMSVVLGVLLLAGCGGEETEPVVDTSAEQEAAAAAEREAEARRAEEEARRRAEEEARRLAEEELRRHPPTYTIARGDGLYRIAGMEKIYGDSKMWPLLFDANRDQIQNPDLIYPGRTLNVPRGMSDAQMQAKLLEMWAELP